MAHSVSYLLPQMTPFTCCIISQIAGVMKITLWIVLDLQEYKLDPEFVVRIVLSFFRSNTTYRLMCCECITLTCLIDLKTIAVKCFKQTKIGTDR